LPADDEVALIERREEHGVAIRSSSARRRARLSLP